MPPPPLSLAQFEMSRSSRVLTALPENNCASAPKYGAHVLLAQNDKCPQATPNEEAERGSSKFPGHRLRSAVELGDDTPLDVQSPTVTRYFGSCDGLRSRLRHD